MKYLDLEQGTQEWLDWRRSRRMASETPFVMGVSPYGSANKIRKDKQGISKGFQNKAMAYGHEQEEYAREHYEAGHTGMVPMVVEDDDGIYAASLDGISVDGTRIIEIKSPYKGIDSDRWKSAIVGKVLIYDFLQVQHQLMVSGADSCDFIVWVPDQDMQIINVKAEPAEWEKIREAWDEFWPTIEERDDDDWREAALAYREAKKNADKAAQELASAKERLVSFLAGENSHGCGVNVKKLSRKGSIDWKQVQKERLADVDLEEYRKPKTTFYQVEVED